MKRKQRIILSAFLILFIFPSLVFSGAVDPNKEYRVALVIGNSAYENAQLKNPVNDANDIAAALTDLGFEVVLGTNLNRDQIKQKVEEFSPMIKKADIGFFYFAGHGLQYNGENFLVPLAFDIGNEKDIPYESLSTAQILNRMDKAGNAVNIVVLDACRNNPYKGRFQSESRGLKKSKNRGKKRSDKGGQGLSRIDGPSGSFVAYATAPGNVAADGTGKNGLYTQHLLDYMQQPGIPVESVFKKVRIGVMKDTKGKQVPWENSSLLGDFYFTASDDPVNKSLGFDFVNPVKAEQKNSQKDETDKFELQFWNSVEKARSLPMYQAYLQKYPQGHFVEIAKIQLDQFNQEDKRKVIVEQNNPIISVSNSSVLKTQASQPKKTLKNTLAMTESFKLASIQQAKPQIKPQKLENRISDPFKASDFVKISPGCFVMGSAFGEEARQNDELDHNVCLTNGFMMGKYEVTQAQWKAVMGKNPAYFVGCGEKCPVERVSWSDVQTFIFRLNLMTNHNYRLPSEAEWEYAARSNTSTATYIGDIELEGSNNAPGLNKIAWYSGNTKVKYKGGKYCEDWEDKQFSSLRCGTQQVGRKQPNSWGLYDMIGNVWELTDDWYGSFSSKAKQDPKGPASGELKVAKGGNWSDSLQQNRAAARYGFAVKEKVNNLGFRLVKKLR
jgi:formylglycine-generating enzyme required for sulfatase activity